MGFKSLKTGIAINLAFFLFLAVFLTDLVVLQIMEHRLIDSRLDSARQWISNVAPGDMSTGSDVQAPDLSVQTNDIISGAMISRKGKAPGLVGELPESLAGEIRNLHGRTVATGKARTRAVGKVWGVFRPQSRYTVISEPIPDGLGAVTAVVPLSPVYRMMRQTQHLAVFYLAINLLILLLLAGWRLSRMMTRPIQRLIRITDEYEASADFEFFPEKQKNEFSRLSGALNQMVRRIEADRDRLQASLDSLEQSNRQLKEAQDEIVRAEKLASVGRLSAGIAHEIGNPIGIVLGYLGLLKSRSIAPDDGLGQDYIQRAESEIQRVNTIIGQLLDFSRNRPSNDSVLSLHELVYEAGEMLSQQPLFSDITLKYEMAAENDRLHADANQLHQVMVNLMINAADSIKQAERGESGRIRLASRSLDRQQSKLSVDSEFGAIELKVIDNGTGIAEQYLDKIFDPFFTTKETGKGTGLGLSVSYMMIQQMGGSIDALPAANGGTEIVIQLPLCSASHEAAADGDRANTYHHGNAS